MDLVRQHFMILWFNLRKPWEFADLHSPSHKLSKLKRSFNMAWANSRSLVDGFRARTICCSISTTFLRTVPWHTACAFGEFFFLVLRSGWQRGIDWGALIIKVFLILIFFAARERSETTGGGERLQPIWGCAALGRQRSLCPTPSAGGKGLYE